MPETHVIEVAPSRLAKGDVLHNGAYVVTGSPDVKHKYVYVPVNDGDTARLKRDETVTVSREFPTEEEKLADQRARAIQWATDATEATRNRVTEAQNRLGEALKMRDVAWHGRFWANFAEAQMELGLWEYVAKVADNREIDLYDALIIVRDEITKRLLDLGHFLPRSTDMLRNYCDGLEAEVRLRFIRDIGWYVFDE